MCTACSCSTTDVTATETTSDSTMVDARPGHVSEFTVTGMTCSHCTSSVTEELQQLDGVRDVAIDLGTGAVTVSSDEPVSADAVAAAVRDVGYQVI